MKIGNLVYLILVTLVSGCAGMEHKGRARLWRMEDGGEMTASLVEDRCEYVLLKKCNGELEKVRSLDLSNEDLRYLRNRREVVNEFRVWNLHGLPDYMSHVPTTFTASFVGVRGLQNERSDTYVILIRDDYRKRAYPLKLMSDEDKAYVEKMRPPVIDPSEEIDGAYKVKWTDYDPVADAAKVNHTTTEHFCVYWGNDPTACDGSGKDFFREDFRKMNGRYLEQMWDFFGNELGFPMPGWNQDEKTKYNIYITCTGLPKQPDGWAFGAESIAIHPRALLEGSSVIPHEFGHGMQFNFGGYRNSDYVGWFWECHANWVCHQFIPSYAPDFEGYYDRSHYELSSTRFNYGSWPFVQYFVEHPRWDPSFGYRIWIENRKDDQDSSIETPFDTMMRLGVEMGIFEGDGVEGFGDMIGETAAHNATWDYVFQYVYQSALYGRRLGLKEAEQNRVILEPVADRPGWYRSIYSHAPRQFGYNVIELVPEPGAGRIDVCLQGIVDETEGSDWRVTLVAADAEGNARYSPMWHQGKGSIEIRPQDKEFYLVVAAAPKIYKRLAFRIGYNKKSRFPYEVSFKGCKPNDSPSHRVWEKGSGSEHPNGGGFVASGAKVDPSAYVGPDAMVLGEAIVLNNARIEDHAIVMDKAEVSGDAVVGGYARIVDKAKIGENARIRDYAVVARDASVSGNARVLEYAHINGNGTIGGDVLIKGFGDVNTDSKVPVSGCVVMGEDLEVNLDSLEAPLTYGLLYEYTDAGILKEQNKDNGYLYARWDFNEPRKSVLKDAFADNDGVLRGLPEFGTEEGRTFLQLKGNNQYAMVEGHVVDTVDITIDTWIKWNGGWGDQSVFDFGTKDAGMSLTLKEESGVPCFLIRKGELKQEILAETAVPKDKWTRITVILGGDEGRLFIDGREAGKNTAMTLDPEDLRAEAGYLGRTFSGGGHFNGKLDDIAVYRRAFADVEAVPKVEM